MIKHNKDKNTAFLYECLTRQITSDVLSNIEPSPAVKIVTEFFKPTTIMGKELVLYKALTSKKLKTDTYGLSTVQSLREMPLSNDFNTILKRTFDIVFSLFVIIFLLSWITPIIGLIIKIESRGPVFFKQTRNGIKFREFTLSLIHI